MQSDTHRSPPSSPKRAPAPRRPSSTNTLSTSSCSSASNPESTSLPCLASRPTMPGTRGSSSRRSRLAMTRSKPGHTNASRGPVKRRSRAARSLSSAQYRASCTAMGSISKATASPAPRPSAARASTPVPVPMSRTRLSTESSPASRSSHSRASRVEAWPPVPKACLGSITISSRPGSGASSTKEGRTTSRGETTTASSPCFQRSLQSPRSTGSRGSILPSAPAKARATSSISRAQAARP